MYLENDMNMRNRILVIPTVLEIAFYLNIVLRALRYVKFNGIMESKTAIVNNKILCIR